MKLRKSCNTFCALNFVGKQGVSENPDEEDLLTRIFWAKFRVPLTFQRLKWYLHIARTTNPRLSIRQKSQAGPDFSVRFIEFPNYTGFLKMSLPWHQKIVNVQSFLETVKSSDTTTNFESTKHSQIAIRVNTESKNNKPKNNGNRDSLVYSEIIAAITGQQVQFVLKTAANISKIIQLQDVTTNRVLHCSHRA